MNARTKLNVAYLNGTLLLAAAAAALADSWAIGVLAWGVLLGGGLATGEIRPRRRHH
jgi:hypothetical protein